MTRGGGAHVERDGHHAWQLTAIGVVISTVATRLPTASAIFSTCDTGSLPQYVRGERRPRERWSAWRIASRLICRSEEHTSELQSRLHLVCRLLLEKKKKIYKYSKSQHIVLQ